ncbi:hypothetical protein AB0G15_35995 [Streptosporangium sp. NPDC023825]|uniref:YybH family protein n=1 Tax=Streptosporangium sp. NPDC023825 TaxID=3154909 RepID=UPI0034375996
MPRRPAPSGTPFPGRGRQAGHGPGRIAATEHLLGLGLPIQARPRHAYVADDIALTIVDWTIHGTAPDGTEAHFEGTAADVARRGPDGLWRYLIDNPFGTAQRAFPEAAS